MSMVVVNDGNDDQDGNALYYPIDTNFPTEEWAATWNIWFRIDRTSQFQTYISVGMQFPFVGNSAYQVCFDGSGGVSDNFAIGSEGNDTYHASIAPVAGQWYRQAYRRRKRGTNDYEQLFWFDLPDTAKIVSRDMATPFTLAAGHWLMWGAAAWNVSIEGIDGFMRRLKIFDNAPTETQLVNETTSSQLVDSSLAGHLWGRWPCVSDGNDLSGNARHLVSLGTVTFDDEADGAEAGPALRTVRSGLRW